MAPTFNPLTLLDAAFQNCTDDQLIGQYFERHMCTFKVQLFYELQARSIRIRKQTMLINVLHLAARKTWPVDRLVVKNKPALADILVHQWLTDLGKQQERPRLLVIVGDVNFDEIFGYNLKKISKSKAKDPLKYFYKV